MDDVQKMFQTIINGQSAMKGELLGEIGKVREDLQKEIDDLKNETRSGFDKVNKRIDRIGMQLATGLRAYLKSRLIVISKRSVS